jgi:hypothetical protein
MATRTARIDAREKDLTPARDINSYSEGLDISALTHHVVKEYLQRVFMKEYLQPPGHIPSILM